MFVFVFVDNVVALLLVCMHQSGMRIEHTFTPNSRHVAFVFLTSKQKHVLYANDAGASDAGTLDMRLEERPGVFFADRSITVEMTFGESEIHVKATEPDIGAVVEGEIDFLG